MLVLYCIGIVLIETACALSVWGVWSNYMLGRGWLTISAFVLSIAISAIAGALALGYAINARPKSLDLDQEVAARRSIRRIMKADEAAVP